MVFNQRLREAVVTKDRKERAGQHRLFHVTKARHFRTGIAADVIFMEEALAKLKSIPVAALRTGLLEMGLVLPPMVK